MLKLLMASSILLQLAKGIWFIEPSYAEAYKPIVAAILSGKNVDLSLLLPEANVGSKEVRSNLPFAVQATSSYTYNSFDKLENAPKGSIAVTTLKGAVMKNDFCGSPGTKTLTRWMQAADANPNIQGHILYTDSPGGSADGTPDFSEAIKGLNKPVLAYSDGLMASAAYWSASGAKEIWASNAINEIGSIGTYMTLQDWSEYYKQMGMKELSIYASASTEKNIEVRSALDGNPDPLIKRILDPFNNAFTTSVTKNRYGKGFDKENNLKGQLHITADALKYGLIDNVGTFQEAINRIQKLSKA